MSVVISRDGTRIAYTTTGSGPPLLLVHGTTADHTRWAPVVAGLSARYTVHAIDRRGRGESSDNLPYAFGREIEDISAVLGAIGPDVRVLAHSFGGLPVIEAALRDPAAVAQLLLYEVPISLGPQPVHPVLDRLEALLANGERVEMLRLFFNELVGTTPQALAQLESLPNWPSRIAAAPTVPREMRAADVYVLGPERLAALPMPALLMLGGASGPFFRTSMEILAKALPNSRLLVLDGQGHTAMNGDPALFLRVVLEFLS